MKENDIQNDLTSIRSMMERSSKFISLSGLSGVLAGIYALVGAAWAYTIVYGTGGFLSYREYVFENASTSSERLIKLICIALGVLVASILTGIILTLRKAKQKGQNVWGRTSRQLLYNMCVPLFTGGALILILIWRGYFGVVAPASLIFYGLALINASSITFKDIHYLGISDILLGLLAAIMPGYGLIFWVIGFGLLHIVYGSIMYFKYDR
ncbi:hypothetical protein FPZ42_18055 [Mucilaginibacter achroorhodeus]|uniref:Uncharacterized protein n=1 Tax=Mucilaginibacter achroorhodeus TaxID=2599294 RepID=A0A563TXD4_9SPHI|nr:hypothetical protein [Mucilaginibacter achroorhodeus]TWR23913.1 hypothetical protein FPZ42_18055 [Mucilaginibacter achroorhodeus]